MSPPMRTLIVISTLVASLLAGGCDPDSDLVTSEPATIDTSTFVESPQADAAIPDADADVEEVDADIEPPDADTEQEPDVDAFPDLSAALPCLAIPPPEAMLQAGENPDGTRLAYGGRELLSAGTTIDVDGFPAGAAVHPDGDTAYVVATDGARALHAIHLESAAQLQRIDLGESFIGIALSSDGSLLYASGGESGLVHRFTVGEDRRLTADTTLDIGGYPGGFALSADDATLWVAQYNEARLVEIDTATMSESRGYPLSDDGWEVLHLPRRAELYVSTLTGTELTVIDLEAGERVDSIEVGQSPAGMAASADEATVWVAAAATDDVVAIDTSTRSEVARISVGEDDHVGADGEPLDNGNLNALAYAPGTDRLYAARGADNIVSVLDASELTILGAMPSTWYPSALTLTPDERTLLVLEGKGIPRDEDADVDGTFTIVDLTDLDLDALTQAASEAFNRPRTVFPFECDGPWFPVPTREGQRTPIEHVVLIVKENKTFDCVFGDLEEMDVDVDPSLVRWGEEITPNQHALARDFTISDNFYTESENSDMGHIFLTAVHLTEFVERIWAEKRRDDQFQGFQILDQSVPEAGNFFTHLLDHDIDIAIYGEIVGMFAEAQSGRVPFDYSDFDFPGGPAVNYSATDESKARYVIEEWEEDGPASFTYILLPNDHTQGTREGAPTPESMVADNDYATGLIIEWLSQSEYWSSTAVFIVEDDPQGCTDHVDRQRSFLMVASPWARRGYVSHVNNSFMSIFATIERILDVPPLGRPDSGANPTWDFWTNEPDFTPYEVKPRIPSAVNDAGAPGADVSAAMDFRSPDRNPDLGLVLDAYRLWQMGEITRAEADRRISERWSSVEDLEEMIEEAEEETLAFNTAWANYLRWAAERGVAPFEREWGPRLPTTASD